MIFGRAPLLALCASIIALGAAAQKQDQAPAPAFGVTARVVQVPVNVHDPRGTAVTNLTREDFRVLDGGAEQKITFPLRLAAPSPAPTMNRLPAPAAESPGLTAESITPARTALRAHRVISRSSCWTCSTPAWKTRPMRAPIW